MRQSHRTVLRALRKHELTRGRCISEKHEGPRMELGGSRASKHTLEGAFVLSSNGRWAYPLQIAPSQTGVFTVDQ